MKREAVQKKDTFLPETPIMTGIYQTSLQNSGGNIRLISLQALILGYILF